MKPLVFIILTGIVHALLSFIYGIFPLEYYDTVLEVSSEYDVDPLLVMSVIKVESDFNEDALSPTGAIGLMQLMRSTAEWLSEDLDPEEPNQNIKLGTMYLSYLLEKYDGDLKKALMAYNIGPGHLESGRYKEAAERYYFKVITVYRIYWMLYFLKFSQS